MEADLLKETVKQAPTLAILCWIVWTFLKHISSTESLQRQRDEKRDENLTTLGTVCHEFQQRLWMESSKVIDRNTSALDRVTTSLAKFEADTHNHGQKTN